MKFAEITLIALFFALIAGIGMLSICIDQSNIPRSVLGTALVSAEAGVATFLAVALFLGIVTFVGWFLDRCLGPFKTHGQ